MNKNVFSYDEKVIRDEINKLFSNDRFMDFLSNVHYSIYKFDAHDADNITIVKQIIILN